jgi:hypothetical protein
MSRFAEIEILCSRRLQKILCAQNHADSRRWFGSVLDRTIPHQ